MTFWIFGYGSLMADNWEAAHQCVFRSPAVLRDHVRSFDKASVEMRGTPEHPAPTLRVVAAKGECHGVAFEFDDATQDAVRADLLKREGKWFPLREKTVHLPDGRSITALVPMYEGKSLIRYSSLRELAQMAVLARGTRSNGVDYVRNIAKHLADAGVEDKIVSDLLNEINALPHDETTKQ